jgi:hypothetical protein
MWSSIMNRDFRIYQLEHEQRLQKAAQQAALTRSAEHGLFRRLWSRLPARPPSLNAGETLESIVSLKPIAMAAD